MTRLTGWLIPHIIYIQGVAESDASRLDSLRLISARPTNHVFWHHHGMDALA